MTLWLVYTGCYCWSMTLWLVYTGCYCWSMTLWLYTGCYCWSMTLWLYTGCYCWSMTLWLYTGCYCWSMTLWPVYRGCLCWSMTLWPVYTGCLCWSMTLWLVYTGCLCWSCKMVYRWNEWFESDHPISRYLDRGKSKLKTHAQYTTCIESKLYYHSCLRFRILSWTIWCVHVFIKWHHYLGLFGMPFNTWHGSTCPCFNIKSRAVFSAYPAPGSLVFLWSSPIHDMRDQ